MLAEKSFLPFFSFELCFCRQGAQNGKAGKKALGRKQKEMEDGQR